MNVLLNSAEGRIWTGNQECPWVQSVFIQEGRVVSVGKKKMGDISDGNTEVICVPNGGMAIPGIIDAHLHLAEGGMTLRSIQLNEVSNRDAFQCRIKEYGDLLPADDWLTGRGWDHTLWGGDLPTWEWLEKLEAPRPVFLARSDGHMALVNKKTMKLSGIDERTPNPPGGCIVKDAQGRPTGILKDTAMELVRPPKRTKERLAQDFLSGAKHLASLGITCAHDMWLPMEQLPILRELFDEGGFPIRLRVAIPVHERKELASYIQKHGRGNEWLQWDMVKIFLDGSIGSNTAWMLEEYLGHPGDCGLVVTQREEFLRQVRECNEENLKVLVHAIGDAAVRTALDVFEECGPGFYRMEHAQHIHPDDLPRFAELGVIPCVQPIHLSDDGRWAEGILGEKRASQSFPFAGLIKSGALLAGGTDWPIAPASPWLNLHAAVARQTNDGSNPDGWYPSQALSLEQALLMSTVSCAQASGEGSCLGMLSPGHWADFAILDRDLFSAPIDCLPNVNVIHRRIAGKQI